MENDTKAIKQEKKRPILISQEHHKLLRVESAEADLRLHELMAKILDEHFKN